MAYDARAIANWFLERAKSDGILLTQMKLQKLVYIAHGWSLGVLEKPLIQDAVEAWKWGPVIRGLYREFREYGSNHIDRFADAFDGSTLENKVITIDSYGSTDDKDLVKALLERVWTQYRGFSAAQLSEMTHRPGTPWHTTVLKSGGQPTSYEVIDSETIRAHYKKLADEQRTTS